MSTLLLPELARENAASNRRIAQSVETVARCLGEQAQETLGTLRRRLTRSAREATRFTLGQAASARGHWQDALALLDDGLEGHEAREVIQAVLEFFDSWFGLLQKTRDLWQTAGQVGVTQEALEDLDAASRDVEVLRGAAEQMRALLTRPRPAVDPAALERARQGIAQGQYKSPEAVRARLRERQG